MDSSPVDTFVLDVDGTLVDSNYQHALAWYRAFRGRGITVPLWRIHRHIGMGGDQLVAALAGDEVEQRYGDELRAAWKEEVDPMIGEISALPGARELLRAMDAGGQRLVLASSGKPDHVEHYLDLLDARGLADAWTSSEDVEQTKPAPDLIEVAVGKVEGSHPAVIGDSTWDVVAAGRIDVPAYAVRTGGFSVEELRDVGAREVYDSLEDLTADLDRLAAGR